MSKRSRSRARSQARARDRFDGGGGAAGQDRSGGAGGQVHERNGRGVDVEDVVEADDAAVDGGFDDETSEDDVGDGAEELLDEDDSIDTEDDEELADDELADADEAVFDAEDAEDAEDEELDDGGRAEAGYLATYDYDENGELYPAVAAHQISKDYGDVPALYPLDLTVEVGQAVALIGHNGSGKSTFLSIAAGLLEPSSGEIDIAGWEVGTGPARATTSYLPDDPVLYDDLSVREHIEYVSRLHGGDGYDGYAEHLLERLGLIDRVDELPSRFSRGLRQKTSIVLGMVRPFSVLLVDEPFVGLDASGRTTMLELLEEAHRDGAAVLVATHEPEFVERVDRCIALRDGRLIFDGQASVRDVLSLVTG